MQQLRRKHTPTRPCGREPAPHAAHTAHHSLQTAQGVDEYTAAAQAADLAEKQRRVDAAEADWVQELEAKQRAAEEGGAPAGGDAAAGGGGRLAQLIDPILGNLQVGGW